MQKSEQINELALALSKAQAEFTGAKMENSNPFFKSKYADLGSVIEAAKPACAKYGLSVTQPVTCDGRELTVTTLLMHQSGQWVESTFTMPMGESRGSSPAQAAGSLITYLRRYSLAAILGIYADEDTDGNEPAKKAQPAQVQRQAEQHTPTNGNGKQAAPVMPEQPPAEANPFDEPEQPKPTKPIADKQEQVIAHMVGKTNLARNHVVNTLAKCKLPASATLDDFEVWWDLYRGERSTGKDSNQAAAAANETMLNHTPEVMKPSEYPIYNRHEHEND